MKPFDARAWLAQNPPPSSAATRPTPTRQEGKGRQYGDMAFRIKCAESYVMRIEPAIYRGSGSDCSRIAFRVASSLITGFDLSTDEARPIFSLWNQLCDPPWTPTEINHKLQSAREHYGECGYPGYLFLKAQQRDRANASQ